LGAERSSRKKLGLALGSGSARGWAHIGVLKALDEHKIRVDFITGTSIGAVVAAVYACGKIIHFEEFCRKITWKTIIAHLDIILPKNGLISGNRILKLLRNYFGDRTIESLPIPYCCVAVDIHSAEEVRLTSGPIVDAIRASISIPGFFNPFEKNGKYLVDGGLANPLPVDIVQNQGADVTIAVDLNHFVLDSDGAQSGDKGESERRRIKSLDPAPDRNLEIIKVLEERYRNLKSTMKNRVQRLKNHRHPPNIFEILGNTTNIIQNKITENNLLRFQPDFIIQPELPGIKLLEFDKAELAIEEGYRKTKQIIPELLQKLN
jgi:NTE family protein